MDLDIMIAEFLRRSKSHYTPEVIKTALQNNPSLITKEGFICFGVSQPDLFVLFCYVIPGQSRIPFETVMNNFAKKAGCTRICFLTSREKSFAKSFPDFKPGERLFYKEVI